MKTHNVYKCEVKEFSVLPTKDVLFTYASIWGSPTNKVAYPTYRDTWRNELRCGMFVEQSDESSFDSFAPCQYECYSNTMKRNSTTSKSLQRAAGRCEAERISCLNSPWSALVERICCLLRICIDGVGGQPLQWQNIRICFLVFG